jgi:hypothetical protein
MEGWKDGRLEGWHVLGLTPSKPQNIECPILNVEVPGGCQGAPIHFDILRVFPFDTRSG